MKQFVIMSTAIRGAVNPPEPLDDANQWRAFSAWRAEVSVNARAEWELARPDAEVVWSEASGLRAPKKRISRDRRGAEWWATAKKAGIR